MKKQLLLLVMMLLPMAVSADTWDGVSSDKSWYDENQAEYYIYNAAQLKGLTDLVNNDGIFFEGKTVYLQNDIDLAGNQWEPIGYGLANDRPFKGVFDGQNHAVINLYIDNSQLNSYPSRFVGFFGQLNCGEIRNLELKGIVDINKGFSSIAYVGGVVAYASNESNLTNTSSEITLNIKQLGGTPYIGNVAGSAQNLSKIYSEGAIHFYNYNDIGQGFYGGVVGQANNLSECSSNVRVVIPAHIAGQSYIGGIVGYANIITDAIFTGRFEVYDTNTTNKTRWSGCIGGKVGTINRIISAPSYYSCSTNNIVRKGIVAPLYDTANNVYYQSTYAQGTSVVGAGVSEDYLKTGAVLDGFDKDVWEFKAGKYPRLKALIPTYTIYSPLEHGSIAYCVKEGGEAVIEVKAEQGWTIEKVFVNQIDATAQMNGNNGYSGK